MSLNQLFLKAHLLRGPPILEKGTDDLDIKLPIFLLIQTHTDPHKHTYYFHFPYHLKKFKLPSPIWCYPEVSIAPSQL